MTKWYYNYERHCAWCNKAYKSKKSPPLTRFCSAKCKQAHHRVYKKYVTRKRDQSTRARAPKVTRKKRKK